MKITTKLIESVKIKNKINRRVWRLQKYLDTWKHENNEKSHKVLLLLYTTQMVRIFVFQAICTVSLNCATVIITIMICENDFENAISAGFFVFSPSAAFRPIDHGPS